jgi:hypothetical protein
MIVFVLLLVNTQGREAYNSLKGAYPSVLRVTQSQYELAEWIQENIPWTSALYIRGTLTYPKKSFIQILSRRVMKRDDILPVKREIVRDVIKEGMLVTEEFVRGNEWVIPLEYSIFDYTDIIAIGDQARFDALANMEQQVAQNSTIVYDKNNIRIYKFD